MSGSKFALPEIDYDDLIKRFNNGESIENLKRSFVALEDAQWEYFRKTEVSKAETDKFKESIGSATGSLDNFKTGLLTAAKNIGIMIGVSLAIQGAIWVFDQINVTLEEQQEIVDDLSKEIESLQTEYDALNSLKNRTGSQDVRLRTLRTELDLLEKQYQKELDLLALNELEGEGDFFSNGVLDNISNSGTVNESISQVDSLKVFENNFRRDAENLQKALNNYETALLDSGKEVFGEQVLNYRDAILDTLSDVEAKYLDLSEKRDAIQKHLDAGAFKNDTSKFTYYTNLLEDYGVQLQDADNLITEIKGILESSAHSALVEKFGQTAVGTLSSEQLAIAYQLDIDDISNFQDLIVAIENYNKQAREADESAKSMSSMIASLEALSDGFDGIKGIYEDVQNMDDFDFNSLISEDFTDIFGKYTVAYDNFVETVANSPKDINACRNAFNDLVTEWFYGQDALKNITDETYAATVAWLQQEGVVNAVEVANRALAESKAKAWMEGKTLEDVTNDEIQKFVEENKTIGVTNEMMQLLRLEMLETSLTHMDLSQQIDEVTKFALTCGVAATEAEALSMGIGGRKGARAAERAGMSTADYAVSVIRKELEEARTQVHYGSTGGSTGSGGSSGSASDPYVAEIDKFEEYTNAVEEVETKLTHLQQVYDQTDDIEERIGLKEAEIALYQEQKDALDALNKARDEEIAYYVDLLRAKGFDVAYDPKSDNLQIKNKEHLNDLSQSIIKDYEEYINTAEDLNDANKESAEQWTELTFSIAEAADEIRELKNEEFDEYVSTQEHIIDLLSDRKDAEGRLLVEMVKLQKSYYDEIEELAKEDLQGNLERIIKLQAAWKDYYDSILEQRKSDLEDQLDNKDAVLAAIENLQDDEIKNIDDEIDALKKTNEERKAAIELQKAEAALDAAKTQKTRKVLRDGVGFVWEADEDAIKEAEETLADIRFEETIESLEKQKEALEELKNKWAEIPNEFTKYQNALIAEQLLGADWEEDILDGRISVFDKFKNEYFNIQQDIYNITEELANHTNEAFLEMMDKFERMIELANTDVNAQTQTSGNKKWYVNRDGTAPSQAKEGDIIYTKGGTYQIVAPGTEGAGYNAKTGFWNLKLNDTSTPIPEGLWGTEIKNSTADLEDVLGMNVLTNQDIVNVSESQIEAIRNQILADNGLAKYIADNTNYTEEEIYALFDNTDYTDDNTDATDDNSYATDKNTDALYDFIRALQELELEMPEEILDPFADLDWGSMTQDEKNYINQLKDAYEIALRQGNEYMAENILAFLQDFKDGFGDEYIQIGKDALAAATNPFGYEGKTSTGGGGGTGTEDRVADLKWLQSKVDEDPSKWSNEFKDRLARAIAIEEYGEGTDTYKYNNGYLTTNIISATNEAENYMTAEEIKLKHDYLAGNTDNGYDPEKMAETIADRVAEAIEDGADSIWGGFLPSDFDYATEVIKDNEESLKNLGITTTGKTSGSSDTKSEGAKYAESNLSKSDNDAIKAAQKAYNDAKAKGDTAGMAAAHAQAEAIRNKNGYSGGDDGSKVIATSNSKLTKSTDSNTNALSDNSDTVSDASDNISSAADTVVSGVKDAVDNISVDVNVSGAGTSGGGSGGSKGGSGSSNSGYKTLGGSDTDANGNKKTVSATSETGGYRVTRYTDGSTKVEKKKARGGLHLPEDIYNVDDGTGSELLVEPTRGRYVKLSQDSAVYTAEATERLWRFAENPSTFIGNLLKDSASNVKVTPTTAHTGSVAHYHIESVQLPNVTDVPSFLKNLQTLPAHAQQYKARR